MGQDDDGSLIFISTPQFLVFDPLVFQGARSFWQLHLKQIIFLLSFSYAAHSFWCLDPRLGRDSIFLFLGHHFLFLFSTSFRWWCNLDFSSIPYMINHRSATWQLHTPSHRFLSLPTLRGLCKYARTVVHSLLYNNRLRIVTSPQNPRGLVWLLWPVRIGSGVPIKNIVVVGNSVLYVNQSGMSCVERFS